MPGKKKGKRKAAREAAAAAAAPKAETFEQYIARAEALLQFYNNLLFADFNFRDNRGNNLQFHVDKVPEALTAAPFDPIKWEIKEATRDGKSIGKGLFALKTIEEGELITGYGISILYVPDYKPEEVMPIANDTYLWSTLDKAEQRILKTEFKELHLQLKHDRAKYEVNVPTFFEGQLKGATLSTGTPKMVEILHDAFVAGNQVGHYCNSVKETESETESENAAIMWATAAQGDVAAVRRAISSGNVNVVIRAKEQIAAGTEILLKYGKDYVWENKAIDDLIDLSAGAAAGAIEAAIRELGGGDEFQAAVGNLRF